MIKSSKENLHENDTKGKRSSLKKRRKKKTKKQRHRFDNPSFYQALLFFLFPR